MPTIVSVSGTSRPQNYTSLALAVVNARLEERGFRPLYFDALDLKLSFPGFPATEDAIALRNAIEESDAVVLATPEYHGSMSAMMKLIIENLGFPSALKDKPVALLGVASGRIGAIKSVEQLRGVCAHVGAIVLPRGVSLAGVRHAFDEAGYCTDEGARYALHELADSLLTFIKNYVCPRYALEAMVREDGPAWTAEV